MDQFSIFWWHGSLGNGCKFWKTSKTGSLFMMQSSKLYMIDEYYIMIMLVCRFDPHLRVNKINTPRLRAKNCCNCDRALGVWEFQYKKGGFNPYQYCTEGIYTISILSNLWLGGFKEFVFSSLSGMTFLVYDFFWSRHPTWSHPQYGNPGNLPGVFKCHIFVCWNLVVFTFSLR
jgi:hypothetical protein